MPLNFTHAMSAWNPWTALVDSNRTCLSRRLKRGWAGPGYYLMQTNITMWRNRTWTPQYGHLHVLEDAIGFGHFHMSIAALFSHLSTLAHTRAELLLAFDYSTKRTRSNPRLNAASTIYMLPLLDSVIEYGRYQLRINITFWNETSGSSPWCFESVTRRLCADEDYQVVGNFLPGGGHCGAWFSNFHAVHKWRHFLHVQHRVATRWAHRTESTRKLRVVLFDRSNNVTRTSLNPYDKRWFHNATAVLQTISRSCTGASSMRCSVERRVYDGVMRDFEENCAEYFSPDIIVSVHGAGLGNLLCARPSTAVVEIMPVRVGKFRDDFWPTMYANLAHQLGLKYCLVRAEGGRGTTAILPNAADLVSVSRPSLPRSIISGGERVEVAL